MRMNQPRVLVVRFYEARAVMSMEAEWKAGQRFFCGRPVQEDMQAGLTHMFQKTWKGESYVPGVTASKTGIWDLLGGCICFS